MPGKQFGALALILIVTTVVLAPALRAGIASAQCSWMDSLTVAQLFDNPHDYRWEVSWTPRYDPDWQTYYGSPSPFYDVRCDLAYGCPTCGLGQTGSPGCRLLP
jgi:hypothetical protein